MIFVEVMSTYFLLETATVVVFFAPVPHMSGLKVILDLSTGYLSHSYFCSRWLSSMIELGSEWSIGGEGHFSVGFESGRTAQSFLSSTAEYSFLFVHYYRRLYKASIHQYLIIRASQMPIYYSRRFTQFIATQNK